VEIHERAAVVTEVIRHRRSTRRFKPDPIPLDLLSELVEAGIHAPSGSNSQNQRFLILDQPDEIQALGEKRFVWPYKANADRVREQHPAGIIGLAPAVIAVFSDSTCTDRRGLGEYHVWEHLEIQNCAASIQNILLLATAKGVATCWVSFSEHMNGTRLTSGGRWQALFPNHEVPLHFKPQGLILMGYPTKEDELGYPQGEAKHGATFWESVKRRPLEHYLCPRKTAAAHGEPARLGTLRRLRLRLQGRAVRALSALTRRLDRSNHRLEEDTLKKLDSLRS